MWNHPIETTIFPFHLARRLQSGLPVHALGPKNHCGGGKISLDISRAVIVYVDHATSPIEARRRQPGAPGSSSSSCSTHCGTSAPATASSPQRAKEPGAGSRGRRAAAAAAVLLIVVLQLQRPPRLRKEPKNLSDPSVRPGAWSSGPRQSPLQAISRCQSQWMGSVWGAITNPHDMLQASKGAITPWTKKRHPGHLLVIQRRNERSSRCSESLRIHRHFSQIFDSFRAVFCLPTCFSVPTARYDEVIKLGIFRQASLCDTRNQLGCPADDPVASTVLRNKGATTSAVLPQWNQAWPWTMTFLREAVQPLVQWGQVFQRFPAAINMFDQHVWYTWHESLSRHAGLLLAMRLISAFGATLARYNPGQAKLHGPAWCGLNQSCSFFASASRRSISDEVKA